MPRFDWNGQSKVDEYISTQEEVRVYINGQTYGRLKGNSPRVEIELVDGQSVLDLSEFYTDEVFVADKVDGQSTLYVRSNGDVRFRGKVDGQSMVVCCASRGIDFRDKIDGQSRVLYSSGGPVQGPLVNGRSTVLWQGQAPAFHVVDGQSIVFPLPAFLRIDCEMEAGNAPILR